MNLLYGFIYGEFKIMDFYLLLYVFNKICLYYLIDIKYGLWWRVYGKYNMVYLV